MKKSTYILEDLIVFLKYKTILYNLTQPKRGYVKELLVVSFDRNLNLLKLPYQYQYRKLGYRLSPTSSQARKYSSALLIISFVHTSILVLLGTPQPSLSHSSCRLLGVARFCSDVLGSGFEPEAYGWHHLEESFSWFFFLLYIFLYGNYNITRFLFHQGLFVSFPFW